MRHLKHRHKLGVKTPHRGALLANLSASLIRTSGSNDPPKAKALRPFAEKLLPSRRRHTPRRRSGKKATLPSPSVWPKCSDREAVQILFTERVEEF